MTIGTLNGYLKENRAKEYRKAKRSGRQTILYKSRRYHGDQQTTTETDERTEII